MTHTEALTGFGRVVLVEGCHRCQRGTKAGEQGGPGGEEGSGWVCRHRNVSRSRVSAVGGRTHIGHGGGVNIF